MPPTSGAKSSKVYPPVKIDLTAETRINKAIETLTENGVLNRLLEYENGFLIEELEESSTKRLGDEHEFKERKDKVEQQYSDAHEQWHKNARSRQKMELVLASLIHPSIFFFSLSCLLLSIRIDPQFSLLRNLILDSTLLLLFFPLLAAASIVISIWNARRRSKDSPLLTAFSYLPPILSFVVVWVLLPALLLSVYPLDIRHLFDDTLWPSLFTISLVLAVGFYTTLRREGNLSTASQKNSDEQVAKDSLKYIKYCKEQEQEIDHLAEGIVDDGRVSLELKHDLDQQDEWSMKIPKYSNERPWRKLGERHDEYLGTKYFKEIREHIDTMDKGSIGIAGERGFGKTALIRELERSLDGDGTKNFLTVWITSPLEVSDEREFLLSVLAKLATRVGKKLTGNDHWPDLPPEEALKRDNRSRRKKVWASWVFVVAVAGGVLLFTFEPLPLVVNIFNAQYELQWYKALLLVLMILEVFILGPFIRTLGPRRFERLAEHSSTSAVAPRRFQQMDLGRPLVAASADLLEELWYERKDVLSSNVSFSYLGGSLGGGQRTEKSRQPFTSPHLVEMWDDYVRHITDRKLEGFGKVVVFIDEVDKMRNVHDIGKFMLALKALYNPLKLFFVVSISEDAHDRFRSRSTPFEGRNEFDSSFDQTFYIKRMDYSQTKKLLNERILGYDLPNPVVLLIWMLSRGNPRDVVRLARNVVKDYQENDCCHTAWELCLMLFQDNFANRHQPANERSAFNSQALSRLFVTDIGLSEPGDHSIHNTIKWTSEAIEDFRQRLSLCTTAEEKQQYEQRRAELGYALTFYEIFCVNRHKGFFKDLIEKGPLLQLIGSVQNYLSHHCAEQALDLLNNFRSSLELSEIAIQQCSNPGIIGNADG